MSLFDEIQARLKASTPAPITGSAQDATLAAFQAKTGKAQVAGGPAASNVGEQVAQASQAATNAQTKAQVTQQADTLAQAEQAQKTAAASSQADLAAAGQQFQIGQQTQAANAATALQTGVTTEATKLGASAALATQRVTAQYGQQVQQLAADKQTQLDDIFETYREGTQDLAYRKDANDLEQTAQKLALADKQYVDKITLVGNQNRLQNDIDFRTEAQRLTLGDDFTNLTQALGAKIDLNADQRTFETQLSQMNTDFASGILVSEMNSKNQATILSGIGKGAESAATYYSKTPEKGPEGPPTTGNEGTGNGESEPGG